MRKRKKKKYEKGINKLANATIFFVSSRLKIRLYPHTSQTELCAT